MRPDASTDSPTERADVLRVVLYVALVAAGLFVALFFAWRIREALLLAFAAVIVAVLLLAATEPVERRFGLGRALSLTGVGLAILFLVAGFVWLLGSEIRAQVSELTGQLPRAIQSLEQTFGITFAGSGQAAPGQGGAMEIGLSDVSAAAQQLLGSLASLGTSVAGGIAGLVVVVVGGFFLAADPELYRRGLVKLFPPRLHVRVEDALATSGRALRLWLLAQLIAMTLVGVLVGLGSWLIGLPAPLALGLFAGLTEFVPLIGPIIGALPALLLAIGEGGWTVLWTVLLYTAVQQMESNLIMPVVTQRMVSIPPALILFAVVAVGLLFGAIGVIIAAPLTVVLFVLVKKLYVRETLGEATDVPGER